MSDDDVIHVRSYRLCFQLERRLHRIDRWRIPVPYGVPLRGIGYAAAILFMVLLADSVPVLGALLHALGPWFAYGAIPIGAAYALTRVKIDGRSPVATGLAWLRWRLGPSRIGACRAAEPLGPVSLGDVTIAPDERAARLRRGVVRGPGRLILRYPVTAKARGRTLDVRQESPRPLWRGKQVRVKRGQRVVLG